MPRAYHKYALSPTSDTPRLDRERARQRDMAVYMRLYKRDRRTRHTIARLPGLDLRLCSHCGAWLEPSTTFFYASPTCRDGLHSWCIACQCERKGAR